MGSLGATYTVYLRLIGNTIVDFLFLIIELFLIVVTAEALRANIDWKPAFLKEAGQFGTKFHHQHFARIERPVN